MTSILESVQNLEPLVRADVPEMQATRRLTPAVVDGLRASGVFGMALPDSLGGPGLSPLEQFEVLEALTYADGSVGWCAMIGSDSGYLPGFLDDDAVSELYPVPNMVSAGKIQPMGTARRSGDGWRVTGRWDFGSGSTHADRFLGGVLLCDATGDLLTNEQGRPCVRVAHLPREAVTVHDTWNSIGMRATASNDFEVTDAHIPDNWIFDAFGPMSREDPLYRLPMWFIVKHAGNTTALARRAIDEAVEAAKTKTVMPQQQLLIDHPGTLEAVARAEAATRSARAFLVAEIERVWQRCIDDGDLSVEVTAPLRLALVHSATVAADVTRSMFDLMTTTAIKADSVFALLAADASVAKTHIVHSHRNWTPLGARISGHPIEGPTVFI
jgi:alkylation response protein AidB-like acyl-CoA dehydrogenase